MNHNQYKAELLKQIEGAVEKFNSQMPAIEKELSGKILELLKDVDVKNGRIVNSAVNVRKINRLTSLIEKTVLSSKYIKSVQEFINAFEKIIDLQNRYFSSVDPKFSPSAFLREVRKNSIDATIKKLTEAGLQNVSVPLRDVLTQNITTGGSYRDMIFQVQEHIVSSTQGAPSKLMTYAKQVTTDALNQYSRNYSQAVTFDLGLKWFQYTGTLLATSRIFCIAMVKKRWFHVDEIPDLLKGNFQEFRDLKGTLNKKTGLPEGMYENTTVDNFLTNLGGFFCGHQPIPVAENVIPLNLRNKFTK